MPDVNHMLIARDIFLTAAKRDLGLTISVEAFSASSPSISLVSNNEGEHTGEVVISSKATVIRAKVWLRDHDYLIIAFANITEHLDKIRQRELTPVNALTHRWYRADEYPAFDYLN